MTSVSNDTSLPPPIKEAEACFQDPFQAILDIICTPEKRGPSTGTEPPEFILRVDGHNTPPTVSSVALEERSDRTAPSPGTVSWRASRQTLMRIFDGERNLANAFISGRLLIAGDMSVMARLQMRSGKARFGV